MDGTGTYGVQFRDAFVPDDLILADPAGPFVKKIRAGFILLQAGMALGLIKDCIRIMDEVDGSLGHVNRYLPQQPVHFKELLAEIETEAMALARDPFNTDGTYWRRSWRCACAPATPPSRPRMRRCFIAARAAISRPTARSDGCARPISSRSSRPPPSSCARCWRMRDARYGDFRIDPTFNHQQERPAMTDVLISASDLAALLEDRTVCRHRHPQSRRLRRRPHPGRGERP